MTDDTLAPEDNPDTVEIEQPGDDAPAPEPSPEVSDAADKPKSKGRVKKDPADSPGNDGKPPEPKPAVIAFVAKQLKAALAGIGEVVERRNTIPILSNVMISAERGRATLIATDLDMECVRILDVEQAADAPAFRTTVAERLLSDIVKKIDGDAMITLTLDRGKVVATAGRARFTLPTLPVEDFPVMTDAAFDHVFEMAAFDLAAMIDGVRFAMCTEETRYYLNGIYLHATEGRGPTGDGEGVVMVLRAVATDGHRLARYDLPQPDGAGALDGVIVPRKAIGVLDKVLDGYEGAVEVSINSGKARFDFADMVLTTKLIDGTFPDYTRVIPSGNDKVLLVDPKSLAAAAGRVMVMADGKTRAVKVALDRDMVTLSCQSPELGEAREEAPGDYDSEALTIGFNGNYLADVLGRIQGDIMRVELADPAAPTLFRDANDEARGLYVLMPMRV